MAQLGLPYVWGGDGPSNGDDGFDCSGLTTFSYAAAGLRLPRTAHTQYYAGPHVPAGDPLQPGDLVFYGTPARVHHVGMYIGGSRMINAPTFGQPVRTAFYRWIGDDYLGATRPAATGRPGNGLLPYVRRCPRRPPRRGSSPRRPHRRPRPHPRSPATRRPPRPTRPRPPSRARTPPSLRPTPDTAAATPTAGTPTPGTPTLGDSLGWGPDRRSRQRRRRHRSRTHRSRNHLRPSLRRRRRPPPSPGHPDQPGVRRSGWPSLRRRRLRAPRG